MGFLSNIFRKKSISPISGSGGWTSVSEPFMGAWQRNMELKREDLLSFHAVFACVSLISKDIGKLPLELRKKEGSVWVPTKDERFKFLEKPNRFQTMQQFLEYWIISKITRGNTYVLKFRDAFGKIIGLIVLNPDLVKPLVSDAGEVFYQISIDKLAQVGQSLILPASEIIHDRWNCFYHPLVGLSPIVACSLAASQGIAIQKYGSSFFANMSRPSGILTSAGKISEEDAKTIRDAWNQNYSSGNVGKTAILGGDMKYVPMAIPASDAQMIEQHKMSAEVVCSVFNVPPFKIGVGGIPQGQKVEDMNLIYYGDCLQSLIEAIENMLDEGLELKKSGFEAFLNLEALLRMDSTSQMNFYALGVQRGIFSPDEARAKFNYKPVAGGHTPYMQQQNFSLEALAKRDSKEDPFANSKGGKNAADSE
ncbi:phage portal protein [Acinetobacter baumannii]|nr:phage portal protein [Acinetobacter baumannii]